MNLMYGPLKVWLDDGAHRPLRRKRTGAALDLMCLGDVSIPAHGFAIAKTGVHFAIESGFCGLLEPQFELMSKHGVICTGGIISAGSHDAVDVTLENMSNENYILHDGEVCAELVIVPCAIPPMHIISESDAALL